MSDTFEYIRSVPIHTEGGQALSVERPNMPATPWGVFKNDERFVFASARKLIEVIDGREAAVRRADMLNQENKNAYEYPPEDSSDEMPPEFFQFFTAEELALRTVELRLEVKAVYEPIKKEQ